jgi:hypothetical protein
MASVGSSASLTSATAGTLFGSEAGAAARPKPNTAATASTTIETSGRRTRGSQFFCQRAAVLRIVTLLFPFRRAGRGGDFYRLTQEQANKIDVTAALPRRPEPVEIQTTSMQSPKL